MSKPRKRVKYGYVVKGCLKAHVKQSRRRTVYRMLEKQNNGRVPCFVCGRHVHESKATLEHILPLSLGGTDDMDNLSISHNDCNNKRGNKTEPATKEAGCKQPTNPRTP